MSQRICRPPAACSDGGAYPVGPNEAERLRALYDLEILGTAADPLMDRVTALARHLLGVPVALVSLLDRDEQWFKSRSGTDLESAPRSAALCNRTILSDDVCLIEDTRESSLYANNPLVQGEPHVRFYAGVALALAPGIRVGTLCVLDFKPRRFSENHRRLLSDLAALVMGQIRLHQRNVVNARQARALVAQEALLSQTERLANVGGWERDLLTEENRWSENLLRIYDVPPGGPAPSDDMALVAFGPLNRPVIEGAVADLQAGRIREFDLELPFTTQTGAALFVRSHGQAEWRDGKPVKLFGFVQDITERKKAEQRLWWSGRHDDLTKLPNRVLFKECLDRGLEQSAAQGSKLGLLLIDVDHFKEVNDTQGHDAGDALLQIVASRLLACVTESASVARLGGDEFAVILPGIPGRDAALAITQRITRALRKPACWGDRELSCRVSIGFALSPDDDTSATELLKDADVALYAAKRGGRDQVRAYAPSMRAALHKRVTVLARARDALSDDGIVPFYQPKVDLESGAVRGFEALLRWRHRSEPGLLSPGAIAEAFEDPELAVEIGQRMLDRVIRDMCAWRELGLSFESVALNVACPEFKRTNYAESVATKLKAAALPPGCLQIEVTETVLLGGEAEAVRTTLAALHAMGVAVSLDDFGTGYASLTHLRQFPVTWLKIDRSFVSGLEADSDAAAITEAVIRLGQSLGIRVVAEGVETPEQAAFLRARGCDLGQGFLFSKPMSGALVPDFLATWRCPIFDTALPKRRLRRSA